MMPPRTIRSSSTGRGVGVPNGGGPRSSPKLRVNGDRTEPGFRGAFALLCEAPSTTGIVLDYDGTLSSIVSDPDDARPLAGAVGILERLTARYGVVAIISGRPVAFLVARLGIGPSLDRLGVYGHYGLEYRTPDGSIVCDPLVDDYTGAIDAATREVRAAVPPGVIVEEKGLALTLHWRHAPEAAPAAMELAQEVAGRHGLAVWQGRKAIELVLPVASDKGSVVARLLSECSAGCVLGDDVGDIPAFAAVEMLTGSRGLRGVRVAVTSPEVPQTLVARSDLVVEGPEGALWFLEQLAKRAAG